MTAGHTQDLQLLLLDKSVRADKLSLGAVDLNQGGTLFVVNKVIKDLENV